MALVPYSKPPKTYQEQLQLLKDRGLKISSEPKALHLLETLNYYRLSGYWYPLLSDPKTAHVFKPGSDFESAFQMYRFDRDLRIFILKEIEKIEVAFRAQVVYTYSHQYGPFWFTDTNLFSDGNRHSASLSKLREAHKKSDEEFIRNFKKLYSDPVPPAWMIFEIASFGCLSTLYQNLKPGTTKRAIAHHFGLDDKTLSSWLHSFVYVRNICAHHSRLWNRGMSIKPRVPITTAHQWLNDANVSSNKTYFMLSMMLYLLQSVDQKHQFIFRFKILLRKYPNIDVLAMGFPKQWKLEPLWKFRPTLKQAIRLRTARMFR